MFALTAPFAFAEMPSHDLYRLHLSRVAATSGGPVFVATCAFANGNLGVLMFSSAGGRGSYFELNHSRTVDSGEVSVVNGGYKFKPHGPGGERTKRTMKTLVMSPYHALTTRQLDTIIEASAQQSCFESVP
jgi:hypothetical protein